jgi:protein-tyrosine phosphatase
MSVLRARQVSVEDFTQFSHVLAMDRVNLAALARICPSASRDRLRLYGDLHEDYAGRDVPDPYYDGPAGFEQVLEMVEAVSARLLEELRKKIGG